MANRESFAIDEWYHCYSRGVDKRTVFEEESEFKRFEHLLYLCNSTTPVHRSALANNMANKEMYSVQRGSQLVALGAYALIPNHFHLLIREIIEGGISEFMRKVGIAYAMYFNIKHERIGNLFVKPFRAKHIAEDDYFRRVATYIHLNPAELFERGWKEGRVSDFALLKKQLRSYSHSSFPDYLGIKRDQVAILDQESKELIATDMPRIEEILLETHLYYRDLK
ncbi:transposase [Candidatus Kaiserbacteria bacterium]|nr:transposase [Candidatus Kaiserbacteria bacterium]